ncbi:MAG: fumarate reductase subunit D [Proteobacteria bacterium]|jgi:fumarate reductase subunit D|nr:fumarate reductase subunit D [Pseudomonadota bacterium]
MDTTQYKQSNEPIFWGLFGFGGMVLAIAAPALILCLLIAGFTDGQTGFHITQVMSHWWGAGALFLILFGAAFHCIHRILCSLHDLKINVGCFGKFALYALASIITLAAAVAILVYYISSFN